MRLRTDILAITLAAVLSTGGASAFAQDAAQDADAGMQLRGAGLADALADALTRGDPIAPTEAAALEPIAPASDSGSATALPWYERFTVAQPERLNAAWGGARAEFNFSAGERWGFTLGFDENDRGPQFEIEDVRAGAFFRLTDRIRLGGAVRFTSPEEDVFGEQGEDRAPELKFESAFRF